VSMVWGSFQDRLHNMVDLLSSIFSASTVKPISIEILSHNDKTTTESAERNDSQSKSFVHLHRRLYLSLFDPVRSSVVAHHELNTNFLIIPFNFGSKSILPNGLEAIESKGPISLAEIYNFDCMMRAVARQNPNAKLVLCAGTPPAVRARVVLLLGCHMILSHGVSIKRVFRAFAPLRGLPDFPIVEDISSDSNREESCEWSRDLTAASCWGALDTAMAHRWLNLGKPFTAGAEADTELCVEEYLHYAEYVPFLALLHSPLLSLAPPPSV
jgi:hypothetical protein